MRGVGDWAESSGPGALDTRSFLIEAAPTGAASWLGAAANIGLKDRPWQMRYAKAECIDNMRVVWTHLGRQPREAEMEFAPSTVGPHAYLTHWKTWTRALEAFIAHVNADATDPLWAVVHPLAGRTWPRLTLPPEEKREPPVAMRYRVLKRDRFRCVLCGVSPANDPGCDLQLDHILPYENGGRTEDANLRSLCARCNVGRDATGDWSAEEPARTAATDDAPRPR